MKRFDRALQELRDERPASRVDDAIKAFAPERRGRPWVPVLAGAAIAGVAIGGMLLAPSRAEARLPLEVANATAGARVSHSRSYVISDGKPPRLVLEMWRENAKVRYHAFQVDGSPLVQRAFDGRRTWVYDQQYGYATVATEPVDGFGRGPRNVDQEVALLRRSANVRVRTVERKVDGRRLVELTADYSQPGLGRDGRSRPEPARTVFLAEADRKLTRSMTDYVRQNGRWVARSRTDFEYPADIPDASFQLRGPKGTPHVDKDRERSALVGRWTTPIATAEEEGVTIRLREVAHSFRSELLIAWTGGPRLPSGARITVRDATGRRFLGYPYPVHLSKVNNPRPESSLLALNGEPTRGVVIYGTKGLTPPLTIEIPVAKPTAPYRINAPHAEAADYESRVVGHVRFSVPKPRRTDTVLDMMQRLRMTEPPGKSAAMRAET